MIILHFANKNEWEQESQKGSYGASCISKNSFVPCIKFSDISDLKTNFYNLKDSILLCIDEDKVNSEIKYEKQTDSDFEEPNIYGKINTDAIIHVLPYTFDSENNFVITKELLDFNVINSVCEDLNIKYDSHKYFHDGTTSRIILLNNRYIIKQANANQLKAEVTFSTFYNFALLQKVAYFDKDYKYVVYNFIPGDVMHVVTDFEDLAHNIKKIVSFYKVYKEEGFGYIENPVDSWTDFLKEEVKQSSMALPEFNNLLPTVEKAIDELDKYQFDKKLIHGDFGTHNFIKQNEKFIAAIDPIPVVGDPAYDLLFALVSNVDLLPYLSINYLTQFTGETKQKIISLLKVVLYCRICRCAKYNKNDLETYVDFWYNLFN